MTKILGGIFMKNKKHILFSNYYDEIKYEDAKQYLIDESEEENYEPTEDEVWKEYYLTIEMELENFECEITSFLEGKYNGFILQGNVGRWNGNHRGGFIGYNFNDLKRSFEDYIEVYDEGGHMYIRTSHHGGNCFYEVKLLTEEGQEYLSNHSCDSDEEVHTRIMNSNFYSKLPYFARDVYSCKE
jgi:hypothetical protein